MKYHSVINGTFLSRPNRFVANVDIGGQTEICHVKNTGRCRELLVPGAKVWLEESDNPARKTRFSLIAVEKVTLKGTLLINMDSQAPNTVTEEWLGDNAEAFGLSHIAREKTWGESRFDFYLEYTDGRKGYLEVKGVTLENDGLACFPDAPTLRGTRHVRELTRGQQEGLTNSILFVIQMKGMHGMSTNDLTDPDFGKAIREAAAAGVQVIAMDCMVETDSLRMGEPVPVLLASWKRS